MESESEVERPKVVNVKTERIEEDIDGESTYCHSDEGNSGITKAIEEPKTSHRNRRPPKHLNDYVTGLETQEENQLQNLPIFSSNDDPTSYEEVVKFDV